MEITFTQHAEEQLAFRKFLKHEIIEAIKAPDIIIKKHRKHFYQKKLDRGTAEIVIEKTEKHLKVVTVYWI